MKNEPIPTIRPFIACAFQNCAEAAMCSVQTPTGWANLCKTHYVNPYQAKADKYCAEHGLDTTEKKIAHCRKLLGLFVAKQVERIPGEDDEPALGIGMDALERELEERFNP